MSTVGARGITGIITPLITPLSDRDVLDVQGLQRLIDHVLTAGVSGIFILGTSGEAPSLSYQLRREMIRRSIEFVGSRAPVFVGVTDTSFVESIHLAEYAASCGADAAVLTMPYYFPAGQTELRHYLRNIIPKIPLPIMLYNMPSMTKVWIEIELLKEFLSFDSVIGVKDSSGDLEYFGQVCALKRTRPDWSIFMGPEDLLPQAMLLGADGGVHGGSNIIPQIFVAWHQAIRTGNTDETGRIKKIIQAFQEIYAIGKYASRHIKATKSALSLLQLCGDLPADPFDRFLKPERQRVADILHSIGVLSTNADMEPLP